MKFFRSQRVSSLIREKLAWIIEREIEVSGGLITITEVQVDKKLERAKVKISILPKEKEAESLKLLSRLIGELQHLLFKEINIRPMPRIYFEIDSGAENAAEVEKALLRHSDPRNAGEES